MSDTDRWIGCGPPGFVELLSSSELAIALFGMIPKNLVMRVERTVHFRFLLVPAEDLCPACPSTALEPVGFDPVNW